MESSVEQRLEALEKEVADLKSARWLSSPVKKDWRSTFGWAKDAPEYNRAMAVGEAYRKTETYEKEIERQNAGA